MAYKQYKSPFTRPQDPPPGDEKERGGKIKAWVEKQDANLESWSQQREDEGKRFGANVHRDASWLLAGGHFNFGNKRNKEEATQDPTKPVAPVAPVDPVDPAAPVDPENKKRSKSRGNFGLAIRQSNFVTKHRKLNMALTNMFHGTKAGKDKNVSGKQWTPWQKYRDAVKSEKKSIREKPLFSQERREQRKNFRGVRGAEVDSEGKIVKTTRMSEKNRFQQKYLVDKPRANKPHRGVHSPHIPRVLDKPQQLAAQDMSIRAINKEIAENAAIPVTQQPTSGGDWSVSGPTEPSQNSTGTSGAQTFCDASKNCTQVNPNSKK